MPLTGGGNSTHLLGFPQRFTEIIMFLLSKWWPPLSLFSGSAQQRVIWEQIEGLKFFSILGSWEGEKKNLGSVSESPDTSALHVDTVAPLCQILLLSLLHRESCHKCLGHRVAAGASKVTHSVYRGAARQTGINISTVCSLLSSCGEGRPSHVTGWGAPARAFKREAGMGSGEVPRHYLIRCKPVSPTLLKKSPMWRKTRFYCTSPTSWQPPFAGPLILLCPQLLIAFQSESQLPVLDRVCCLLTQCPCQPPASLTAILGSGRGSRNVCWMNEWTGEQTDGWTDTQRGPFHAWFELGYKTDFNCLPSFYTFSQVVTWINLDFLTKEPFKFLKLFGG